MYKGPPVTLQALHDESFTAEKAHAQPALEGNADADALRRGEKRVLLSDQFSADLGQMHGNNLSRIGSTEGDLSLTVAPIEKNRHEQRLARQKSLPRSHQCAEESAVLLRS